MFLRTPRARELLEADEEKLDQLQYEFDERKTIKKKKPEKKKAPKNQVPKTLSISSPSFPSIQKAPENEEEQNKLAEEMLQWLYQNPQEIKLEAFPLSKWISPYKFFRIGETNDYFNNALNLARREIGARIQERLGDNPQYLMRMLPLYHDEFQAWEMRKQQQDTVNAKRDVYVEMVSAPNSDKVPVKK